MNERDIIELIYSARQNNIHVFLNEGQLQVKLPKDKAFDNNLLEQLKANKSAVTAFLKANESGASVNNKISRYNREAFLRVPLSFSQERLWFVDQLEGTIKYHLPSVIRIKGSLDITALNNTLKTIVTRHAILRTVILEEGGQGYQQLLDNQTWQLEIIDGSYYKEDLEGLHDFIQRLIDIPFDLSKDFLLRAHLIQLDEHENILLVTIHHIASDAWSTAIIVNEVIELYRASVTRSLPKLKPLDLEYADYAVWQRDQLQGEKLEKSLRFWQEKLTETTPLNLPVDHFRSSVATGIGAISKFNLSKELSHDLRQLSRQHQSTTFITLLAAFNILLQRYCRQLDISVGTSIAGRTRKELEGLVGFFVNLLVLRNNVNDEDSFIDLLQQVKTTTLEASEHQDVPFEKVVDLVTKERDMSKNPLVQVMFIMLNTPEVPPLQLGDVVLTMEDLKHTKTLFDISFFIKDTPAGIEGWVEYNVDLYSESIIAQLINSYTQLLTQIVAMPETKIRSFSILSKDEEKRILYDFNNKQHFYDQDKNIVVLFEEQAAKTPLAPAILFEEEKLTYQELNERSNQLANFLVAKGIKDEALVPICVERSVELLVGIIGILKAGGAYVPIDPKYPAARVGFMLKDSSATLVLCTKTTENLVKDNSSVVTIVLDEDLELISKQATENLKMPVSPDHLAYVMYTSGSTGMPKGVMVEHKNVVSLVKGVNFISSTEKDILLSTGSPSFDATTFEYWSMLLNGGQLILCREDNLLDKDLLKAEIGSRGVTKMWFTSSWFNQLADTDITVFEGLETLVVGGEKLSEKHISKVRNTYPEINIINGYGPTENTTFSLIYLVKETEIKQSIPIGSPLTNRSAYIIDGQGHLAPVGVTGEIYLGGAGLARGYLNNPELTKEKFIQNPFSSHKNSFLYKTGDLGYWLTDGNIQYQGRIDDQVKIRGYRIELGEIESVLATYNGVLQNVVVAKTDDNGRKRLIAYIVAEAMFDREDAMQFLRRQLPEYMVPSVWVQLDVLPITSNGKIDKKSLPDPDTSTTADTEEFDEPLTGLQARLAVIWQDLLDVERVKVDDNFFELGGDSILAIQFVSRARSAGIEIKVADVFGYQTIKQLSEMLDREGERTAETQGDQGKLTGVSPLLPVQQWYFDTQHVALSHFNQSVLLNLDKSITEQELSQSLKQLFFQHDALRFKYYQEDGRWKQEYAAKDFELTIEDVRRTGQQAEPSLSEIADRYQRSLDIEKGEIFRAVLMKTPETDTDNKLLIIVHHLAVDGVSWRILLEELSRFLIDIKNGSDLVPFEKTSSYRQWYSALEKYGQTGPLLAQLNYWVRIVNTFEPLSTDTNYQDAVQVKEIQTITSKLDADLTRAMLKEVPRIFHTEINDVLLCALSKVLAKWMKKRSVVIGLEGHGREPINDTVNISRTVGWFTSLYPVLLEVGHLNDFGEMLKAVKEQLRQVPDKGLGFGVLKYINNEPALTGKEAWDVQYNYLGQLDNVVKESAYLTVATESTGAGRNEEQLVDEKLSVNSHIHTGQLISVWRFSTKHFKAETINELANSYVEELKLLIAYCLEQGKTGSVYTPSDFGLGSSISYEELDTFLEEDNIDNIMSF